MNDRGRQPNVQPQLSVRNGRAAVEFYKEAFGAFEAYRFGGTDDHEEVVAQLSVGDAFFWVEDESAPHENFSPELLGGATSRMLLIVDDPVSVLQQAVAAGAARDPSCRRRARVEARADQGSLRPPLGDRPPARGVAAAWLEGYEDAPAEGAGTSEHHGSRGDILGRVAYRLVDRDRVTGGPPRCPALQDCSYFRHLGPVETL